MTFTQEQLDYLNENFVKRGPWKTQKDKDEWNEFVRKEEAYQGTLEAIENIKRFVEEKGN